MGDVAGAVRIFELNARQYPESSNVFDSLGEADDRVNRRDDARTAYSRAIELDPAKANARDAPETAVALTCRCTRPALPP
jgi:serine-type D-Ala-D-Ala carboxypeptidase/endopeptidase